MLMFARPSEILETRTPFVIRHIIAFGAVVTFALLDAPSDAIAQSGSSTIQRSAPIGSYPNQGYIVQGSPSQGSATQGSTMQGSTMQGSTMQGSTMQGSTMQGSSSQGAATSGSSTSGTAANSKAMQTFEAKFWQYLNTARYREWAPVAGTSGDAYPGQSPHGAMLKMYLSRKAAGLPDQLPTGSVLVKENFGPDGKTLMAITTMYRAKNYDGGGTGWYWTKYNPDGSVASKDGKRLAGAVGGCIECHAGAAGGDHAFFND